MATSKNVVLKKDCDVRFTTLMEEFKEVREDIKDISVLIAELPEKIWEKADQRYAPKWVGDAMKAVVLTAGVAAIGAVLKLILI